MYRFVVDQDVAVVVSIAASVAVVIVATLRLKNRIAQGGLRVEDYFLIPSALALAVMLAGIRTVASGDYANRTMVDMSLPELISLFKGFYYMELIYIFCLTLLKASILLSYRRILHSYSALSKANYTVLGLHMAWGISAFFGTMFHCVPISKFWDPTVMGGHCSNHDSVFLAKNIPDVILNAFILFLSMAAIKKSQISKNQRCYIAWSLAFGLSAVVISGFRASLLPRSWSFQLPQFVVNVIFVSSLECSTAIIAANLPFVSVSKQDYDFAISDQDRDDKGDLQV